MTKLRTTVLIGPVYFVIRFAISRHHVTHQRVCCLLLWFHSGTTLRSYFHVCRWIVFGMWLCDLPDVYWSDVTGRVYGLWGSDTDAFCYSGKNNYPCDVKWKE